MAQLIPIFLLGVLGAAVLLLLKHFNIQWAIYLLTTVLFVLSSYIVAAPDWPITVSNITSMAVLFFLPLTAALYLPKFIHKSQTASIAVLVVGGFTALTFQYAGLGVATVLGVQ